jgi:Flp pilus assembly secretin CpaC
MTARFCMSITTAPPVRAYETAVSHFDSQRKSAATAVFRLAECHRKLGRSQEAIALYRRVQTEFADQATLADLSRTHLARLGVQPADDPLTSRSDPNSLGVAQRKIELEVRAVELTRTESGEMGFDWFLGNTEAKPKSAGVFPGGPGATVPGPTHTPASATNSWAPGPGSFQLSGILTEHQFSVVLGALERRPDTEIISLPRVTTASRQPTGISWSTAAGSTVEVQCLPVAGADGYSLDLQLTVDYGDNPPDELDPAGMTAIPASARQASTRRAVVWSGQTIVVGGLISESVPENTDETLRRLRNLIVFITPSILDAAGNRMRPSHPFDPDTIPLQ